MNLKLKYAELLSNHVDLALDEIKNLIEIPPDSKMGDLAFPCFSLAKKLKNSPVKIAESISGSLEKLPLFKEVKNIGPYVNAFVDPSFIAHGILSEIAENGSGYSSQPENGKNVVVDFSSPNIAKPLAIHHLRSTMIGNSISQLYSKMGYNVIKLNYLGDWGTQFGKLIVAYNKWGSEVEGELTISKINELYVKFSKESSEDNDLNDQARNWFKKLEEGNAEAIKLWKWFKEISLIEFEKIYKKLGITFDVYGGESEHAASFLTVVEKCESLGISSISDGALIVESEDENDPPCLIRKSDGATTYEVRDIAALLDRFDKYEFVKMFYVVGQEQALHFKMLKMVVKKMGLAFSNDCEHISFGFMKFQGKSGSTREGTAILMEDVLNTSVAEVRKRISESGSKRNISEEAIQQIGIGAVVFGDLSKKRVKDSEFIWEEVTSFEGDTGPYLQYTQARCLSIVRKSNHDFMEQADFSGLTEDSEKLVLLKLNQFSEAIINSANNCEPSLLANYLLELAKFTNRFIHGGREEHSKRILQESNLPLQSARTALVHGIAIVLKEGLRLLGISSPEEM
ncbi:MAG: arginine--tRNA ligase [Planctomycetota bacterium]|nr:MAG: arginine--tRNA ligase [Planctomycetota bacterium]